MPAGNRNDAPLAMNTLGVPPLVVKWRPRRALDRQVLVKMVKTSSRLTFETRDNEQELSELQSCEGLGFGISVIEYCL